MKNILMTIVFLAGGVPAVAQESLAPKTLEIAAGGSALLYQSEFSFQPSFAVEAAVRREINPHLDWQAGARLGINPALPEFFARLLVTPQVGAWRPLVGIELGGTNRARFGDGEKLLRETRAGMEGDISAVYVAGYTAPLVFQVAQRWRLSLLEIQFGTHLGHTGRTARLQLGLISIGRTL